MHIAVDINNQEIVSLLLNHPNIDININNEIKNFSLIKLQLKGYDYNLLFMQKTIRIGKEQSNAFFIFRTY